MPEFLKDPIIVQYIVAGISLLASIIVVISAFTIRKNRKHIEKTTKLLGEASIHLEETFDSMLKAIIGISELRKLYPREGDVHVQVSKEKKKIVKIPSKKSKDQDLDKTIELTEEVEVLELTDEVKKGNKK